MGKRQQSPPVSPSQSKSQSRKTNQQNKSNRNNKTNNNQGKEYKKRSPSSPPKSSQSSSLFSSSSAASSSSSSPSAKYRRTKPQQDMFDPDNMALSKQDVLEFCDDIIKKWQDQDPVKNARKIYSMAAVRTSIMWTDEESVKSIWKEIIKWVYELLYSNAIAQGKAENYSWTATFDRLQKSPSS